MPEHDKLNPWSKQILKSFLHRAGAVFGWIHPSSTCYELQDLLVTFAGIGHISKREYFPQQHSKWPGHKRERNTVTDRYTENYADILGLGPVLAKACHVVHPFTTDFVDCEILLQHQNYYAVSSFHIGSEVWGHIRVCNTSWLLSASIPGKGNAGIGNESRYGVLPWLLILLSTAGKSQPEDPTWLNVMSEGSLCFWRKDIGCCIRNVVATFNQLAAGGLKNGWKIWSRLTRYPFWR